MSLIARIVAKQNCTLRIGFQHGLPSATVVATKSTGSAQQQMDNFWMKNKTTNRPMSPHLTIYKFQLTSMLSITHRATGILLAGDTIALACATLLPPQYIDMFLNSVEQVHSHGFGYLCLFPLKFMLAWPIMFHVCNGLRHLMWDTAKGLKIGEVYSSGWGVVVISTILAALISLACTSK